MNVSVVLTLGDEGSGATEAAAAQEMSCRRARGNREVL